VAAVAEEVPAEQWSWQTITEGSKGPLMAACAAVRVIAMREGLPGPEVWLVLRRNAPTGELKTDVSNAPADTALTTLVRLSGMRWPIETCFEDSKQYLGLGDDEGRNWRGWHHHMTLCILAHGFRVRGRLRLKKKRRA
jgi:SRSO17 transposase